MKKIDLNGIWKISGKDNRGNLLTFDGTVPGTVHSDLIKKGIIINPLVSDNNKECMWIEKQSWEYERVFEVENPGKKMYIEFSMLDVYCDIYVNGIKLGYCDNMFVPHRFEVGDILKKGENRIKVKFYPPDEIVADKPKRNAAFTYGRLYTRRIQCTYLWDWVDRFVTMGICGDVSINEADATEIDNVHIRTLDIDKFGAQLSVSTDFCQIGEQTFLNLQIVSPHGQVVCNRRKLIVEPNLTQIVDIPEPLLWYPAGYGDANLYIVDVTVEDEEGNIISERRIPYGIRKVKILQLEDLPGSEYYEKCLKIRSSAHIADYDYSIDKNESFFGFVVIINEVPVMCKGANWVPSEPFVSEETPERITTLLELAAEGGMNMLRVWGGGIFETEHFYSECDRLGLMVCQDFLMACGDYPQEEADFCAQLKKEAEYITKRLRNNCSLIWWSGDNENAMWANDNMPVYNGRIAVRGVIEPIVRKNDPDRYFFASSPYGGAPYGCATCGTTHNTGYLGITFNNYMYSDMKNYRQVCKDYISRFSVEEPILGAASEQTAFRFMSEEEFLDPDEKIWRFHTKNNPGGFKNYSIFDVIRDTSEKLYGTYEDSYDKLYKMQYFQYDMLMITMELYRRNKGFSNGLLYWMLNDCWPAFGWAIIDYYAKPKAAWYGFKRSSKGVIASLDCENDKLCVYVCNDTLSDTKGTLIVRKVTKDGVINVHKQEFYSKANVSAPVCEFEADTVSSDVVYVCDIEHEGGKDRALWFAARYSDTGFEKGKVRIVEQNEDAVVLKADTYVHAVMLEGEDAVFEDNCFAMLPGEQTKIGFRCAPNSKIKVRTL